MQNQARIPQLKGKPFFEQLKLSINFIDSNMKLIDHSVKTSNTDEEYNYVKKVLGKMDEYNDDVNGIARCLKVTNCLKQNASEFDDEVQNLKDILRCKEMQYQLEPYKYPPTQQSNDQAKGISAQQHISHSNKHLPQSGNPVRHAAQPNNFTSQERRLQLLNRNTNLSEDLSGMLNGAKKPASILKQTATNYLLHNKATVGTASVQAANSSLATKNTSSLKKRDTFILKENQATGDQATRLATLASNPVIAPAQAKRLEQTKEADVTNESLDPSNQFSFDFKLPYNKLKNNYFPSSSNFSVDESLEIEFTPGLKSRRTAHKKPYFNESNASTQELAPSLDKHALQLDSSLNRTDQHVSAARQEVTFCVKPSELDRQPEPAPDRITNDSNEHTKADQLSIEHKPRPQDLVFPSPKNVGQFGEKIKPHKLSTPKKPPNFDFLF